MKTDYFVGVDVGTQSVRAGLVAANGSVVNVSTFPITTHNPCIDIYEQSADHIWDLCVKSIKEVIKNVDPSLIKGIGFDATCSLVCLDKEMNALSISKTDNQELNIILWMDHRAINEANLINNTNHKVLQYVGGKISPEMEIPKILWIKKNLPQQWSKVGYLFDLPDFLTWKATGSFQRSLCSLVCKWTYLAGDIVKEGWQDDFFCEIGLDELLDMNYCKIGSEVLEPGLMCGQGLNENTAISLGLKSGTPVSISIIDAHAGGLGVLSCSSNIDMGDIEQRLALICGTSTCHMKVSKRQLFTPGVWGPYFSAMVPEYWCSEAGQSAAGALLDHVVSSHPASVALKEQLIIHNVGRHITDVLNDIAIKIAQEKELRSLSSLTSDFHVYPDYHGNRSPLANPNLKGMICGLTLSSEVNDLVKQYIATLQALAYSTRHIINALDNSGHVIKSLFVCGGLSKNKLYIQMHADVTGLPVIIPSNSEPVIVGSAILGASAAKYYPSVLSAMSAMCGRAAVIMPNVEDKEFHDKKYDVYLSLLKCQEKIAEIMST